MRLAALGLPPYSIEDATNNFDLSNLIGEQSQSYIKGRLNDGSMVMVVFVKQNHKSLSKISDQTLKVLPYLSHRHLVSVLSHCALTYPDHPKMASTILYLRTSQTCH
jgi:hypothetical protein